MRGRAVFFVSHAGYEVAWQSMSLGLTAAAMGDDVVFVFAFEALKSLSRGTFGKALNDRETKQVTRAEGIGAPQPARMLEDARSLGARAIACETTVKLCGLVASDLTAQAVLDDVMGLTQIWKLTENARVLCF